MKSYFVNNLLLLLEKSDFRFISEIYNYLLWFIKYNIL